MSQSPFSASQSPFSRLPVRTTVATGFFAIQGWYWHRGIFSRNEIHIWHKGPKGDERRTGRPPYFLPQEAAAGKRMGHPFSTNVIQCTLARGEAFLPGRRVCPFSSNRAVRVGADGWL